MSFQPTQPPSDPAQLAQWLVGEFARLAQLQKVIQLEVSYVAPAKPRDGMIAFADGTSWNPGAAGRGFYGYVSGSWVKL